MMQLVEITEINALLPAGWKYDPKERTIGKEFTRQNFNDAVAMIVAISKKADALDHHPDILLHGYNKVKITLTTHSAGGVTQNDITLAQQIESIE